MLQMLGYCVKPPAMIFEYMENGSLFEKLHKVKSQLLVSCLLSLKYPQTVRTKIPILLGM